MMGRRFGGAAMQALLLVAAPVALVTAPAAQAQGQTTGRNVTSVTIDAGPGAQFVKQGPDRWAELDARGRPAFYYREKARDAWIVYLNDTSRGIELQLDLRRRKVAIVERGRPRRDLYNIVRFTHRVGSPDVRDRDTRDVRDRDLRDGDRWGDRGGPGGSRQVEVGPIWNQRDAETKCRAKAGELRGEWTGQWHTTVPGRMSVCEIGSGRGGWDRDDVRDVEVGPIWNQRDAETKCRAKADDLRGEWTGAWNTVRTGVSVCGIRLRGGNGGSYGAIRNIEVGPIWNQRDAETKCRAKAGDLRAEWTGQWRTTIQGRMSECELRFR